MMETILSTVWQLHKTLLIIIPILLIIRYFLSRFPKRYTIFLWVILAFRLIIPFSFTSSLSIFQNTSAIGITPINVIDQTTSNLSISIPDQVETPATQNEKSTPVSTKQVSYAGYIILGWLLGITFLACTICIQIRSMRKRIRHARCWHDNVYVSEHIQTPFVFGIRHPRIYLPVSLQDLEVSQILLHEQMHIRTKDHIIRPLGMMFACIHWFNPLIWICYHYFIQDIELACDERVIRSLSKQERADYSNTLLLVSTMQQPSFHACLPFGKNNTKQRIQRILSYKKTSVVTILTLVILLSFVAISLISNPKTPNKQPDSQPVSDQKVDDLYQLRTDYVGDNVAVSNIINALYDNVDHFELETTTDVNNYGISIYLNHTEEKSKFQLQAMENSKLMFGLIKNINHISFINSENQTFTVTKTLLQRMLPTIDFTTAFDDEVSFQQLYQEPVNTSDLQSLLQLPYDIRDDELLREGFSVITDTEMLNKELAIDFIQAIEQQQPAKFQLAQTTTEGDIILTLATYQNGNYTVVNDTTRDGYGRKTYTIKSYTNMELKRFEENERIQVFLVESSLRDLRYEELRIPDFDNVVPLYSYPNT